MTERALADQLAACTERCRAMDAPLSDRLSAFAHDVRRLDPDFADVVERMVARLRAAGAGSEAPRPGEPMPEFLLPDERGRLHSLEGFTARGPVVIAFHRGHWCPYCRISAGALAEAYPSVRRLGAELVAITPEVSKFNAELKHAAGAPFPVLSDMDNSYAMMLNLAFYVGDEKKREMSTAGWDITPFNDSDAWTLPIPATFVVGRDGLVKARFIDPDYRTRMNIEDILAALGGERAG
ncbi:MAG: peroxiredoxin-like family protein [Hyphomicrobium sp.]|uniref:peroxiredoxin-like family protein n=1 Tax=Hyphomicrobium sp. TaxID=82 RepID=UPI003D0CFD5B